MAQASRKSWMTGDEGKPSSIRLMSLLALPVAAAPAGVEVSGVGEPGSRTELALYFLIAAFALEAVRRLTEDHMAETAAPQRSRGSCRGWVFPGRAGRRPAMGQCGQDARTPGNTVNRSVLAQQREQASRLFQVDAPRCSAGRSMASRKG